MNWKEKMKNVDMIEFDTNNNQPNTKIFWLIWSSALLQGKTLDFLLLDYIKVDNQYVMILFDENETFWLAYIPPGKEIIMTLAFSGHAVQISIERNKLQKFKASIDKVASDEEIVELMKSFKIELEKATKIRPQTYKKVYDAFVAEEDTVDIP